MTDTACVARIACIAGRSTRHIRAQVRLKPLHRAGVELRRPPGARSPVLEQTAQPAFEAAALVGEHGAVPLGAVVPPLAVRDVAAIWQRDALLTDIVCACVKRNDVLRVFDLTAMEAYRRLIDWHRIAADGTDVLHCFDTMAAGESALTSFGRFFRYLLSLDDDELIGLDPEYPSAELGTCRLRSFPEPPPGCPTETWPAHMAAEVLSGGNPDTGARQFTPTARQHGPAGHRRHDAGPWKFTTTPRFHRDAKAAFEETLKAVMAVMAICNAPRSPHGDVKPLSGHDGLWRYRLGERRLVYEPDPTRRVVRFLRFGPRGDVYSGL